MSLALFVAATVAFAAPVQYSTQPVAEGLYPEGPVWTSDATMFVEYSQHRVVAVRDGIVSTVWERTGCGPASLHVQSDRQMFVTCYDTNTLVLLDANANVVKEWTTSDDGFPLSGINDLASDAFGGLYLTASGVFDDKAPITGAIFYLNASGALTRLADDLHYPNGIGVSPDQTTLYVAEHLAGRILRFPLSGPGTVGARSVLVRLRDLVPEAAAIPAVAVNKGYFGPDGFDVDASGDLIVAYFGLSRLLRVDASGVLVQEIPLPSPYPTNVAIGTDGRLAVTVVRDAFLAPYTGDLLALTPR